MLQFRNSEISGQFTSRLCFYLSSLVFGVVASYPASAIPSSVSAGRAHVVVVTGDGTMWSWGSNESGQLGDGTNMARVEPAEIGSASSWNQVSSGSSHTLALSGGSLWAWGSNVNGQVGDGTRIDKASPVRIGNDSDWAQISANGTHSLALKRDGSLWGWGSNAAGQLGDGTTTDRLSPVRIGLESDWVKVAAGGRHSLAFKLNGTAWAWGGNWEGQLGTGNTTSYRVPVQVVTVQNVVEVEAGWEHSLVRKGDGTLWAWGQNNLGQLGDGTTVRKVSPIQVGNRRDWIDILSRGNRSLAISKSGALWGWGANQVGQLGDGSTVNKLVPTQIGFDSSWVLVGGSHNRSLAVRKDGSIWDWGRNQRTGLQGDEVDILEPRQTSVNGSIKLLPASLNFGAVQLGNVASLPLTFKNDSDDVVALSGISVRAPFATSNSCDFVNARQSCTMFVQFQPASIGSASGDIQIRSSAFSGVRRIEVAGVGAASPTAVPTSTPAPTSTPVPTSTPTVQLTPSGGQCREVQLSPEWNAIGNSLDEAVVAVSSVYRSQIALGKQSRQCASVKPPIGLDRVKSLESSIKAEIARTIRRSSVSTTQICGESCVSVNLDEAARQVRNRISNLSGSAQTFARKVGKCRASAGLKDTSAGTITNLRASVTKIRGLKTSFRLCGQG